MSISLIVEAVFVILALALVVNAFWPIPGWPGPRSVWPRSLLWLLLELLVLAVVYWVVRILFLGDSVPLRALSPSPLAAGLFVAAVNPTPTPASGGDTGGYRGRYWLNVALVGLSVVSVVGNFVTTAGVSAAFLGLSDVTWHWILLVFGGATALNTAFNRTPPVTAPPNAARLAVESRVHAIRKALAP